MVFVASFEHFMTFRRTVWSHWQIQRGGQRGQSQTFVAQNVVWHLPLNQGLKTGIAFFKGGVKPHFSLQISDFGPVHPPPPSPSGSASDWSGIEKWTYDIKQPYNSQTESGIMSRINVAIFLNNNTFNVAITTSRACSSPSRQLSSLSKSVLLSSIFGFLCNKRGSYIYSEGSSHQPTSLCTPDRKRDRCQLPPYWLSSPTYSHSFSWGTLECWNCGPFTVILGSKLICSLEKLLSLSMYCYSCYHTKLGN